MRSLLPVMMLKAVEITVTDALFGSGRYLIANSVLLAKRSIFPVRFIHCLPIPGFFSSVKYTTSRNGYIVITWYRMSFLAYWFNHCSCCSLQRVQGMLPPLKCAL